MGKKEENYKEYEKFAEVLYNDDELSHENELDNLEESTKTGLFAEIYKNAKLKGSLDKSNLLESKALPGGNLDSGEVTDYEKWLEQLHNKQDKAKEKEDPNWAPRLFDKECSENGYHDWEGKKLKSVQEFVKQYNSKK